MPPTTLRTPTFKLGNRATTSRTKQQDSTAIRRSHLPQLRPKAFIIRVSLTSTFPRQPIDLFGTSLNRILILQFQIKLHSFLQTFTSRLITLTRSCTTAELNEDEGKDEESDEANNVREVVKMVEIEIEIEMNG